MEFTVWPKASQEWCSDSPILSSELGRNGDPAPAREREYVYPCNLGGTRKEDFDDFPPLLEESDTESVGGGQEREVWNACPTATYICMPFPALLPVSSQLSIY